MTRPLAVGDVIHGFAYGAFGRDHYDCVRIEAVGPDWIVAREPDTGRISFAAERRALQLCIEARDEPCSWVHERRHDEPDARCPLEDAELPLTTAG